MLKEVLFSSGKLKFQYLQMRKICRRCMPQTRNMKQELKEKCRLPHSLASAWHIMLIQTTTCNKTYVEQ